MTRQKLVELYQSLNAVGNLRGVKFAYAVIRNLNILQPEIEALQKSAEPSKDFNIFEMARVELAKKHAKKDKNGEAVVEANQFVIENKEKFDKEFVLLRKKHKEAVANRDKQIAEYNKLLEEEVKIELFKIKMSDVPQDISTEQLKGIFEVIEE